MLEMLKPDEGVLGAAPAESSRHLIGLVFRILVSRIPRVSLDPLYNMNLRSHNHKTSRLIPSSIYRSNA
jgi:hypothetical protein